MNAVLALLRKDLIIEFRNRYVLGGVLLYVFSSVLVVYFALQYNSAMGDVTPAVWSILFWLIILFSAVNAVANSFFREPEGRFYYYYWVSSPQHIIIAKLMYNLLFTSVLAVVTFLIFILMVKNPIQSGGVFLIAVILGGTGYSFLFTTMSAIASRAGNNATLMAVLGFPLTIPLIIFLTRITIACVTGEDAAKNLLLLGAFDMVMAVLGFVLFPYIWRD